MWQPGVVPRSPDAQTPPSPTTVGAVMAPSRSRIVALVVVACVALSTGCGAASGEEDDLDAVRVAVTADGEGQLLGQLLVELVERAELPVEVVRFADARDARQALELGAVDVRAGYTGEAWLETLGRADPPGDPEASFGPVRVEDGRRGVTWLPPRFDEGLESPPANATFAFVVAGPPSADADLRTVSQLATRLGERPDATVCVDREFGTREDGLRAVLDAYRVRTDRPFVATTPQEAVRAVAGGQCIAGLTTATDGEAWATGLRPLVDDLEVFPAFVVAAQVRDEVLEERPELGGALRPMAELTTASLGRWNAQVATSSAVEEVAEEAVDELVARRAANAADGG